MKDEGGRMKGAYNGSSSFAALQCGKASAFRAKVRKSLSLLRTSAIVLSISSIIIFTGGSFAQTSRPAKTGAHSTASRDAFTTADRPVVPRDCGATCTYRLS